MPRSKRRSPARNALVGHDQQLYVFNPADFQKAKLVKHLQQLWDQELPVRLGLSRATIPQMVQEILRVDAAADPSDTIYWNNFTKNHRKRSPQYRPTRFFHLAPERTYRRFASLTPSRFQSYYGIMAHPDDEAVAVGDYSSEAGEVCYFQFGDGADVYEYPIEVFDRSRLLEFANYALHTEHRFRPHEATCTMLADLHNRKEDILGPGILEVVGEAGI